jgi:hypothetical protein
MLYLFQKSSNPEKDTEVRFNAKTSAGEEKTDLTAETSAGTGKTDLPLPTQEGMCKLLKFHSCSPPGQNPVSEIFEPSQPG